MPKRYSLIKHLNKRVADLKAREKSGKPVHTKDLKSLQRHIDTVRAVKGDSSTLDKIQKAVTAKRAEVKSSITAKKTPIGEIKPKEMSTRQLYALSDDTRFKTGHWVKGKGFRTNVELYSIGEEKQLKNLGNEIKAELERRVDTNNYWTPGTTAYGKLHSFGNNGRPNNPNAKRKQIVYEKKARALERHERHMQNYMLSHPIRQVPITIDGKTQMINTRHKTLAGMEIRNNQVVSTTFNHNGLKQYMHTPTGDTGADVNMKANVIQFVSGLSNPGKQDYKHAGSGLGAFANSVQYGTNVSKPKKLKGAV